MSWLLDKNYFSLGWRPSDAEVIRSLKSIEASEIIEGTGAFAVLADVFTQHCNEIPAIFHCYLKFDENIEWFLRQDLLTHCGFFHTFFSLELVQHRMKLRPRLKIGNLGFECSSPFSVAARLQELIARGQSLCPEFSGSDSELISIVSEFMKTSIGNEYRKSSAFVSTASWAHGWGTTSGYDPESFFIIDKQRMVATVFAMNYCW